MMPFSRIEEIKQRIKSARLQSDTHFHAIVLLPELEELLRVVEAHLLLPAALDDMERGIKDTSLVNPQTVVDRLRKLL